MNIVGESAFGKQRHLGRNGLPVVHNGHTRSRVGQQIEVVGAGGGIKRFGGQQLVLVHERQLFLIKNVATLKIQTWQIGCLSLLPLIAGLLYLDLLLNDFLIVGDSHTPTRIERHLRQGFPLPYHQYYQTYHQFTHHSLI